MGVLSQGVNWAELHFKRTAVAILLSIPLPSYTASFGFEDNTGAGFPPSLLTAPSRMLWLVPLLLSDLLILDSLRAKFLILFSVYISLFNFSSLRALTVPLYANDSEYLSSVFTLLWAPVSFLLLPILCVHVNEKKSHTHHAPNWTFDLSSQTGFILSPSYLMKTPFSNCPAPKL